MLLFHHLTQYKTRSKIMFENEEMVTVPLVKIKSFLPDDLVIFQVLSTPTKKINFIKFYSTSY